MTTARTSRARRVAILALPAFAAVTAHAAPTPAAAAVHAASPSRQLSLRDFSDEIDAHDVSHTDDGTVDGHVFARAIALDTEETYVSLNTRRFPGYRTLEFHLGVSDTAVPPMTSRLLVQADGLTIMRLTVTRGQPARLVDVPLVGHTTITLIAQTPDHSIDDLVVGDPRLLGASATPPLPTTTRHPLRLGDFSDQIGARDVSHTDDGTVDGHVFDRAIALDTEGVYVALATHRFLSYRMLEFRLGIADSSDVEARTLVVQADGLTIMRLTVASHQPARRVDISLTGHTTITLTAHTPDHSIDDLVVGDPALLT